MLKESTPSLHDFLNSSGASHATGATGPASASSATGASGPASAPYATGQGALPPGTSFLRLSPERLAEEIALHGRSPITWLLGAGFSRGAGLPLASEVWQLLAISWLQRRRSRLGGAQAEEGLRKLLAAAAGSLPLPLSLSPDAGPGLPQNELSVPEEIDTETAHLRDDLLRALSELRDRAAPDHRGALLAASAHPAAIYRAVFELAAPTPEVRKEFLQALLTARCRGPALSHLLLAALLCGDRGPRMHTVFTVGFDDLLLEAMLTLRKQARLFCEPQARDQPLLSPAVAQIVHLHGRTTGYLQSEAEPGERADWLYAHLRESSVIACGFSGNDAQTLATLRRFVCSPETSGLLYWVVHREAQLGEVERRLAGVPRDRVRLVVRQGALSADELMMELCGQLLPASAAASGPGPGLEEFFSELLRHNGHRLQGALSQLASHFPQRDPLTAQLRALHLKTSPAERQQHLSRTAELSDSGNVPAWRAQVYMAEMREHLVRGQIAEALVTAEAARTATARIPAEGAASGGDLLRYQTLGLCGELALWLGQQDLGKRHLQRLLRDEAGCPVEWREEARYLLLSMLYRTCQASRQRDSQLFFEIRALLDLRIDTPVAAVRSLLFEAELFFLQGDLRRALLLYESADEVAHRHAAPLLASFARSTAAASSGAFGAASSRASSVTFGAASSAASGTASSVASGAASAVASSGAVGAAPPQLLLIDEFDGPGGPGGTGLHLTFASPAPSEVESEAILLRAARQARFGLLLCRVAVARDSGGLPRTFQEDVADFLRRHPVSDGEGHFMAAVLLHLCIPSEPGKLRLAEEHAEAARGPSPQHVPPWRSAQVFRVSGAIALLANRYDDAERFLRQAQHQARRAEQYDEDARVELVLAQLFRERGRRGSEDEKQRALRRAVAHGEVAWLRGLELGSTWLTEEADDFLSSLRATPTEIAADVTPIPE